MNNIEEIKWQEYRKNAETVATALGATVGGIGAFLSVTSHKLAYFISGATIGGGCIYFFGQKKFDEFAHKKMKEFDEKERKRIYPIVFSKFKNLYQKSLDKMLFTQDLDKLAINELYQFNNILSNVFWGIEPKNIQEKIENTVFLSRITEKTEYISQIIKN